MRRLLLTAIVVVLASANSWGATNYNSSKSNVYLSFPNATITTATINFPGGTGEVVYTTPATGDFILTQFCAGPSASGGILLDAANFGTIAEIANGVGCHTFTPGMSIPPNTALICSTVSAGPAVSRGTYFCTISGMQTTASSPTPTPTASPAPTATASPSPVPAL
jgi:hypothetical protein